MLILAAVFHERVREVAVGLTHPHGEVKTLVIECAWRRRGAAGELAPGYHTRPSAFVYYPRLADKHPFDACAPPKDLPSFVLANADGRSYTDEDWGRRDTVRVCGGDAGMVAFAELLLNVSLPRSKGNEFELEGESGFRGVGVGSAEARLFLPGNLAWTDGHWREGG